MNFIFACVFCFFALSHVSTDALAGVDDISSRDFLRTKAAQLFMKAKYKEALPEFEALERLYPKDLTVKRYRGYVFDRLGMFDEALRVFEAGLKENPDNPALRYALAQTLMRQENYAAAEKILRDISNYEQNQFYRQKAVLGLQALKKIRQKQIKKAAFFSSFGTEWQRNPSLEADKSVFQSAAQDEAMKYYNLMGARLVLFKNSGWTGSGVYKLYQSYYSDGFDRLNIVSETIGFHLEKPGRINGRPSVVNVSHNINHTLVHGTFYSVSALQEFSLDFFLSQRLRLRLRDRWGVYEYNNDGSDPPVSSRDGMENISGLKAYFYLTEQKNSYLYLGFDYENHFAQGKSYERERFCYEAGWHFPLPGRWEAELNLEYKDIRYPKFAYFVTDCGRGDYYYDAGLTLSKNLAMGWILSVYYYGIYNLSSDDHYSYTNHVAGSCATFYF